MKNLEIYKQMLEGIKAEAKARIKAEAKARKAEAEAKAKAKAEAKAKVEAEKDLALAKYIRLQEELAILRGKYAHTKMLRKEALNKYIAAVCFATVFGNALASASAKAKAKNAVKNYSKIKGARGITTPKQKDALASKRRALINDVPKFTITTDNKVCSNSYVLEGVSYDSLDDMMNAIIKRIGKNPDSSVNNVMVAYELINYDKNGIEIDRYHVEMSLIDLCHMAFKSRTIAYNGKLYASYKDVHNALTKADKDILKNGGEITVVENYFSIVSDFGDKKSDILTLHVSLDKERLNEYSNVRKMEMMKVNTFSPSAGKKILFGEADTITSSDIVKKEYAETGAYRVLEKAGLLDDIIMVNFTSMFKELGLLAPNSDSIAFPIRGRVDGFQTFVKNARELRDRFSKVKIDGEKIVGMLATMSQRRQADSVYLIKGDEKHVARIMNILGYGHYLAMKGQKVKMKVVTRLVQDMSSSTKTNIVLFEQGQEVPATEEFDIACSYAIKKNPIVPVNGNFLDLNKVTGKIDIKEEDTENPATREGGDGAIFCNEKVMIAVGYSHGEISRKEYLTAKALNFNPNSKKVERILDKCPRAAQIRPFKGVMICVPSKTLRKYGYTSDIVVTESALKGEGRGTRLSVLNVSHRSGKVPAKINNSFLQVMLVKKARRNAIVNGLAQLAFNQRANCLAPKTGLNVDHPEYNYVGLDKYNNLKGFEDYPYSIAKRVLMEFDRENSIIIPGAEYKLIIEDPIFVLSDGKDRMTEHGGAFTNRNGKCMVLRNPISHINGINVIDMNDTIKAENKGYADYLMRDNLFVIDNNGSNFLAKADGADTDGDKVFVMWAEDVPFFFLDEGEKYMVADKWLLPFDIDSIEGDMDMTTMDVHGIFDMYLNGLFRDNGVGKVVNTCLCVLEAIQIKYYELVSKANAYKNNKDASKQQSLNYALLLAKAEFDELLDILGKGKRLNNLCIDLKATEDEIEAFMSNAQKPTFKFHGNRPLTINGTQRDLTRCEFINGLPTAEGKLDGIHTSECVSIVSELNKKLVEMDKQFLKTAVFPKIVDGLNNRKAYHKLISENQLNDIARESIKEGTAEMVSNIKKEYGVGIIRLRNAFLEDKGISIPVGKTAFDVVLDDDAEKEFRSLIKAYNNSWTSQEGLGDVVKDARFALEALKLADDNMCDNLQKILKRSEEDKYSMQSLRDLTKGCAFAFNLFGEGLQNLMNKLEIASDNDIIISDGYIYKLKEVFRDFKKVITPVLVRLDLTSYNLPDGFYPSVDGVVTVNKALYRAELPKDYTTAKEIKFEGNAYVVVKNNRVYVSPYKNFGKDAVEVTGVRKSLLKRFYSFEKGKVGPVCYIVIKPTEAGFTITGIEDKAPEKAVVKDVKHKTVEELINAAISPSAEEEIVVDTEVKYEVCDGEETADVLLAELLDEGGNEVEEIKEAKDEDYDFGFGTVDNMNLDFSFNLDTANEVESDSAVSVTEINE